MNDFEHAPRPDDVLGDGFEADWQRRHDELAARAKDVDLAMHFTPEETAGLEAELLQLGIPDGSEFLRIQVVRHGDAIAGAQSPVSLGDFTGQVVAGLRDGPFS